MASPSFVVTPPDMSASSPSTLAAPSIPSVTFPWNQFDGPEGGQLYTAFGLVVEIITDEGLRWGPKAGPKGTGVAIWRQHGGMTFKVISAMGSKVGGVPLMPSIDTGSANDVFIGKSIAASAPENTPDGGQIFAVTVRYWYVMQQSPAETDAIFVPNEVLRAPASRQIYPALFSATLAGPVTPPAGFSGTAITY